MWSLCDFGWFWFVHAVPQKSRRCRGNDISLSDHVLKSPSLISSSWELFFQICWSGAFFIYCSRVPKVDHVFLCLSKHIQVTWTCLQKSRSAPGHLTLRSSSSLAAPCWMPAMPATRRPKITIKHQETTKITKWVWISIGPPILIQYISKFLVSTD